ncbi:MAG: hypothetical protein Q7S75_03430 [bacterium]|nr:hypothetical protein [bacterium]
MYQLFIDESGTNTLKSAKSIPAHFLIGGTLVHRQSNEFIRRRGDQIKFKYWGHTNVTFRGVDMRRLTGDFSIFQDVVDPVTKIVIGDNSQKKADFQSDFLKYVQGSNFKFICICVNKDDHIAKTPVIASAVSKGWKVTSFEKQLTRNLFEQVVKVCVCHLSKAKKKAPASVQIIVEACNITQDGELLAIYNQYMFCGLPSMNMSSKDIRNILTSISFATKNNRDTETQLADVGSHFMSLKYRGEDNMLPIPLNSFETGIIKAFDTKGFNDKCSVGLTSVRRL